jgi:dUTP pyrophosphatase
MFILKIKKLNQSAKLPTYAHPGDAGLDLFASVDVTIPAMSQVVIPTGVAMEIPKGMVGFVWDKSGLAVNSGLKTMAGVVDSGYRGEVLVCLINLSKKKHTFKKGDKIAQMVIQKKETVAIKEIKELSETKRGAGGFGSTGK